MKRSQFLLQIEVRPKAGGPPPPYDRGGGTPQPSITEKN